MRNKEDIFPQGKLCISSVHTREEGFADYRYMAYLAATKLGFYAVRNPEDKGITQENFESILIHDFPVFILIVGVADSKMVNKEFETAKKNCLPVLVYIKKYKGEISKKTENILKHLSKVTYENQCTTFNNCEDLYEAIEYGLKNYIRNEALKSMKLQKGITLAYSANTRLMKQSKRQIIINQKTSILILGPRQSVQYEFEFYRTLLDWLNTNKEDIEFIHIFCWDETIQEIKEHADKYDLKVAKNNLKKIYQKFINEGRPQELNIRLSHNLNSTSYVITDTNLVFVLPIENERYTIELPSHLMKVSEIDKIKEELYLNTTSLKIDQIDDLYIQ